MNNIFLLLLFWGVYCVNHCSATPVEQYPLRLQPEFDRFDATKYFNNDKLMRLLFRCLMFDEPCDLVGKFVKPRAKGALLGKCELCTPPQEKLMNDWFEIFKDQFPEMHRAAVKKFVENEGEPLTEKDLNELTLIFTEEAFKNYMDVYRDVNKMNDENDRHSVSETRSRTERSVNGNINGFARVRRQTPPVVPPTPESSSTTTESTATNSTESTTKAPTASTTLPPTDTTTEPPKASSPDFKLPPPFDFKLPPPPEFKLPSPTDFKLPSPSDFKLPSPSDFKLPSPSDFKLPSPSDFKVPEIPSPPELKSPSPSDFKLPSPSDFKVPEIPSLKFPDVFGK